MVKICYLMVGVSGSGKSTVVSTLLKQHPGAKVFSLDTERLEMFKADHADLFSDPALTERKLYELAFEHVCSHQSEFNQRVNESWQMVLGCKDVIVVDNTNLTRKSRTRWVTEARAKSFSVVAIQVMVPLGVVLARQRSRLDKMVPSKTVNQMYLSQEEVLLGSEADFLLHVDGTAANVVMTGLQHF